MEFWGVEVKAGEKLKVQPEIGKLIHISQAAMCEVKDVKVAKNVYLRMKINDQNFIIGSLSAGERTQVMFDLVFEKEFELSHDLKNGSVYFIGYAADDPVSEGEEFSDFDDESEDEEEPIETQENGTTKAKAGDIKPAPKAKKEEKVALKVEDDSDGDEDDSDEEMAFDGLQEDSSDVFGDSDDEEDEDDSSEEELPKANLSKKRPSASVEKTPVPKKAKSATPDKTGKKGQNATPIPAKSDGKTPNKPKGQSPKSGGQVSGKSFPNKNSSSGKAKGKHGGK